MKINSKITDLIGEIDTTASLKEVEKIRNAFPDATPEELVEALIQRKCMRAGIVGAVTSGAALIPGLGSVAAITLGVAADIGMTFKLQTELAFEIAAVYDQHFSKEDERMLALTVTGLSTGSHAALENAGKSIAQRITARFSGRSFVKAIPYFGIVASTGTNMATTYMFGRAAQLYFSPQIEETSLQTLNTINEQRLINWASDQAKTAWSWFGGGVSSTAKRLKDNQAPAAIEEQSTKRDIDAIRNSNAGSLKKKKKISWPIKPFGWSRKQASI